MGVVLFAERHKRKTKNSTCKECLRQYVAYFEKQRKCYVCLTPEERSKLIPRVVPKIKPSKEKIVKPKKVLPKVNFIKESQIKASCCKGKKNYLNGRCYDCHLLYLKSVVL